MFSIDGGRFNLLDQESSLEDLFIPSSVHITVRQSQQGSEETGSGQGHQNQGLFKSSAVCFLCFVDFFAVTDDQILTAILNLLWS